FDEIEKAHPDVFNVLLQVLDDGRITDSQGRTVDFKNTVIVMTSNLGSNYILEGIENGEITASARAEVEALVKRSFRPEFLNRIDDIVFYKPLSRGEIYSIMDLQLKEIKKRLVERRLDVALTDAAKDYIALAGYDPQYGARPLKRLLSSKLETLLARKIIEADPTPDTVFTVDYDGERLTVK
ncbi:MAG TPA: AAA family ATPase, partial [Clostridia bacterium]|nr:AAA family ATPase [Clostridia bacterium]